MESVVARHLPEDVGLLASQGAGKRVGDPSRIELFGEKPGEMEG